MSALHPRLQLMRLVRALDAVEAHNRLMRAADRDIAIVLLFAAEADAALVLGLLAPPKADRVRAEIVRNRRARVSQAHHTAAINVLMEHLAGVRAAGSTRSYYRPPTAG